jgi:hypothetical protein
VPRRDCQRQQAASRGLLRTWEDGSKGRAQSGLRARCRPPLAPPLLTAAVGGSGGRADAGSAQQALELELLRRGRRGAVSRPCTPPPASAS